MCMNILEYVNYRFSPVKGGVQISRVYELLLIIPLYISMFSRIWGLILQNPVADRHISLLQFNTHMGLTQACPNYQLIKQLSLVSWVKETTSVWQFFFQSDTCEWVGRSDNMNIRRLSLIRLSTKTIDKVSGDLTSRANLI